MDYERYDSQYLQKIFNNKFIFLYYWYFDFIKQYNIQNVSIPPGGKEGISASIVGGYNVGITKFINKSKLNATLEIFKYITSKDMQRKFVKDYSVISGIPSLYEEEEICNKLDCEFINSLQLLARPKEIDYEEYSKQFRQHIFDYLFKNKPILEVLQKIVDIKKIYSVSLNTEDTMIGLITFIIIIAVSVIELLSMIFLFIEKFKPKFEFLSKGLWITVILGSLIILYSNLFKLGEVKNLNCQLKIALLFAGNSLIFIPIFYKLIENFPIEHEKVKLIVKNRNKFILGLLLIELIFISLIFISPFTIKSEIIDGGKNFQVCKLSKGVNFVSLVLVVITQLLLMLCILFLTFLEWNIETTRVDIRLITLSIYTDVLLIIVLAVLKFINIKSYRREYLVSNIIYIGISVSNFTFLYGIRIIFGFMKGFDNKLADNDIKLVRKSNVYVQSSTSSTSKETSTSSKKLENKILSLHYMKTPSSNGASRNILNTATESCNRSNNNNNNNSTKNL